MPDISLQTANSIYTAAGCALLIGTVLTLFGTGAGIWTGGIRDKYADERIKNSEATAATANENAAEATKKTAELQVIATNLNVDLEKEKIERLKLEAQIAPRRISQEQGDIFERELKAVLPLAIQVTRLGDQEATIYANIILTILQKVGVRIGLNEIGTISPPRYGITLILDPSNAKGGAVKRAFEQAKIPFVLINKAPINGNAEVFVGLKPL